MTNPLSDSSTRRLVAFLIGIGALALNKKVGLELTATDQAAIVTLVMGYIGQSTVKELKAAKMAGEAAAAEVATPAQAIAAMGADGSSASARGPQP